MAASIAAFCMEGDTSLVHSFKQRLARGVTGCELAPGLRVRLGGLSSAALNSRTGTLGTRQSTARQPQGERWAVALAASEGHDARDVSVKPTNVRLTAPRELNITTAPFALGTLAFIGAKGPHGWLMEEVNRAGALRAAMDAILCVSDIPPGGEGLGGE
jgi:hypothetical protein